MKYLKEEKELEDIFCHQTQKKVLNTIEESFQFLAVI